MKSHGYQFALTYTFDIIKIQSVISQLYDTMGYVLIPLTRRLYKRNFWGYAEIFPKGYKALLPFVNLIAHFCSYIWDAYVAEDFEFIPMVMTVICPLTASRWLMFTQQIAVCLFMCWLRLGNLRTFQIIYSNDTKMVPLVENDSPGRNKPFISFGR